MKLPEPRREAALDRLRQFKPHAGKYARERNFDFGPDQRGNVSMLSAYLRNRLVTEEEVALSVLEDFAPSTVEKFLQEVAWRTYWKGWLEMRPEVWSRYRQELADLPRDAAFERAVAGETGIECFDFWARELCDTGYLHNHARMWFASIWIFTLRLPWQLGADFFLRHLLDGDPATNTLSWRWVGGLHTRGKHYLARASNIRKFTAGRFDPAGQLDETAEPLPPDHDFERESLVFPEPPPTGRLGHLMLADDLAALDCEAVQAVAGWYPEDAARLGSPSEKVVAFHRAALEERVAQRQGEILSGPLAEALRGWVEREALDGIVLTRPTVGPWRDLVREAAIDVPLYEWVHDWDRQLWPHATAGYFKLKKKLPPIFKELAQRAREGAPTADS